MAVGEPRILVGYACPRCDGTGRVQASPLTLRPAEPRREEVCSTCGGSGNRKECWLPLSKVKHMLDEA